MEHTIKRFALKYPGETNYNFVGLDDRSGGYPYATSLSLCELWGHIEGPQMYQKMFPELEIVEVTITAKTKGL